MTTPRPEDQAEGQHLQDTASGLGRGEGGAGEEPGRVPLRLCEQNDGKGYGDWWIIREAVRVHQSASRAIRRWFFGQGARASS
ncbi:MAG TPA: hypothetical protein VFV38_19355 [Ktedonobacteraceae bacterium]|nr:hypothetical protein [Ktedonobacteraceae bacterium]